MTKMAISGVLKSLARYVHMTLVFTKYVYFHMTDADFDFMTLDLSRVSLGPELDSTGVGGKAEVHLNF